MASTLTEKLVESAFAIEDRPLPPGALQFMHLQELIRGHPSEENFGQLFTADPVLRLDAVLDLSASYLHSLKNGHSQPPPNRDVP
jgi:hypothetical protein